MLESDWCGYAEDRMFFLRGFKVLGYCLTMFWQMTRHWLHVGLTSYFLIWSTRIRIIWRRLSGAGASCTKDAYAQKRGERTFSRQRSDVSRAKWPWKRAVPHANFRAKRWYGAPGESRQNGWWASCHHVPANPLRLGYCKNITVQCCCCRSQ